MIEASNRILEMHKPHVPKAVQQQADGAAPAWVDPDKAPASKDFKLFGAEGFGFHDVLDIINPLQHIPVVATIYRRVTGDEISPGARIAGDTLYGGPIGAAIAMADTAVEYKTGRDVGSNALAMLMGDDKPAAPGDTAIALAAPSPTPSPTASSASTAAATKAATPPPSTTLIAASTTDLGALNSFATGAGNLTPARPGATTPTAMVLEPRTGESWQPPANTSQTRPETPAGAIEPAAYYAPKPAAPMPYAQKAMPAAIQAVMPSAAPGMNPATAAALSGGEPTMPGAPGAAAERPMPSQAAMSQAINALAAMPTSQTTAAVAQLASTNPNAAMPHRALPPPSDIPRGASASLSRGSMRALALNGPKTTAPMDAKSAATAAALETAEKATPSAPVAQNDWMIDAMQNAMNKYQASARLQSADANAAASSIAVSR